MARVDPSLERTSAPYVIVTDDVLYFQAGEFVFQFMDFGDVVVHPLIVPVPFLVNLLYDKFGVPKDYQSFDSQ